MRLIGECSITKKKAKREFEYPMVRFPKEFRHLIGKKARIYRIDENNFLVSLELHNQLSNFSEDCFECANHENREKYRAPRGRFELPSPYGQWISNPPPYLSRLPRL